MHEHIVLKEISFGDMIQIYLLQSFGLERHKSVLRVEDVPITGCQFCEERKAIIAQEPQSRHISELRII